jgi:hypothetical protein
VIGDIDALDALDDAVEDDDDPNDEDYVEGDESNGEEENNNENVEVSDTAENDKKKRPISLAEHKTKKKAKSHPALELMSSLSTAPFHTPMVCSMLVRSDDSKSLKKTCPANNTAWPPNFLYAGTKKGVGV